ncbi:MAG: DoxX family protein, partial [Sulfurovum sp. 24-42-9]
MLKTVYPMTKNLLNHGQSFALLVARLTVAY